MRRRRSLHSPQARHALDALDPVSLVSKYPLVTLIELRTDKGTAVEQVKDAGKATRKKRAVAAKGGVKERAPSSLPPPPPFNDGRDKVRRNKYRARKHSLMCYP